MGALRSKNWITHSNRDPFLIYPRPFQPVKTQENSTFVAAHRYPSHTSHVFSIRVTVPAFPRTTPADIAAVAHSAGADK